MRRLPLPARGLAAAAILIGLGAAGPHRMPAEAAAPAQPPRDSGGAASGPSLYRAYCASCHGVDARGDGPVAPLLRLATPDLTTLAARADGIYPRALVVAAIDGRSHPRAHGPGEMPVWGDVLRVTEGGDERPVARRLAALADHLESIQRRP